MGILKGHRGGGAFAGFVLLLIVEALVLTNFPASSPKPIAEIPCDTTVTDSSEALKDSLPRVIPLDDPKRWVAIDSHALAAPVNVEDSAYALAQYLCPVSFSDWEKARAIFRWIADRIRYDDVAYNSGRYGLIDVNVIFKIRRGVCEDYANLFNLLAELAGIPSRKIIGFTKEFTALRTRGSLEPDHAWNAVYIDSAWHLLDVTWAGSFGQMSGRNLHSTKRFEDYWFDTPPKEFVFTHLPSEGRWQLLDKTLSVAEFECLPQVTADFFSLGYEADSVRAQWEQGQQAELPMFYMHDYHIRRVETPGLHIIDPDSLQLRFLCPDCKSLTAQSGGRLIDFEQCDSLFCLDLKPKKGPLRIYARKQKYARQYNGIMEFWVRGHPLKTESPPIDLPLNTNNP